MPIVLKTSLTTNYISFFDTSACRGKINEDGNTKCAQPVFAGGFPIFVRFWRIFAKFLEEICTVFMGVCGIVHEALVLIQATKPDLLLPDIRSLSNYTIVS
jgi:hypothetical protein